MSVVEVQSTIVVSQLFRVLRQHTVSRAQILYNMENKSANNEHGEEFVLRQSPNHIQFNEVDDEESVIMNADLLITKSSERRRVLFYANRNELPYNLKILMKYNSQLEELAADEYFERMVQLKNDHRDHSNPSEAEITAAEKHQAFQSAVASLCAVSNNLNNSLLKELEDIKHNVSTDENPECTQ